MTVVVAGTVRVPVPNLEAIVPPMLAVVAASRAEDGCIEYSYGLDVGDPGLIRVFEIWRDREALDAHFQQPHMDEWREARAELGLSDRRLVLYEVASQSPL